jgi:RNA polymerase sigma-70 factor (ECF subfamily)
MVQAAEALLRRASAAATPGRYQIEAALQSAHVHRRVTGQANWPEVVRLYDLLLALTRSPVVAVNRALAVGEVEGAARGLDALPDVVAYPKLREYQPYWAARAELLARTGAHPEARAAYDVAIGLERDPAVRRFLEGRRSAVPG